MSRLVTMTTALVALAGCALPGTAPSPFSPATASAAPATASRPTSAGSAPTSTAPVQPIASTCHYESRTPEMIADGVPPAPCESDLAAGSPAAARHDQWENRKAFVRVKVAAAPGRAVVGRFRAPWCSEPDDRVRAAAFADLVGMLASGERAAVDTAADGARWLCIDPDDPRFQDLGGAYVQAWVNATGGTVAEVSAYLALWATDGNYQALARQTCTAHARGDGAGPREHALELLERPGLGCTSDPLGAPTPLFAGPPLDFVEDSLWHLDREAAPPSQLAELGWLAGCMTLAGPTDLDALVHYARCRPEAATLDDRALAAELDAMGANPQARATAALSMSYTRLRLAQFEAALQQAVAADPDLRAVLVDAGQRGWNQWQAAVKAERAAVDAAHAYEKVFLGDRKSAKRGCADAAMKAFVAHINRNPAHSREDVIAAATDHVGGILTHHVQTCFEAEDDDAAGAFGQVIGQGAPRRGPRFAVTVAMREALAGILSDRERFAIDPAMLSGHVGIGGDPAKQDDEQGAVIAKVETRGDRVYVTFKIEKLTRPALDCVETRKVDRIDNNGQVIYRWNCVDHGRKETITSQATAIFVAKAMATGLVPGNVVAYTITSGEQDGGFFAAAPIGVWKDKAHARLVAYLGVPIK